jgi:hypothetical protein
LQPALNRCILGPERFHRGGIHGRLLLKMGTVRIEQAQQLALTVG